jgi:hypothetical protein
LVSSSIASRGLPNAVPEPATSPNPWIISPVMDFLFVYGGLVWVLLCATALCVSTSALTGSFGSNNAAKWLLILFPLSQHLLGNPHTGATYWRIYGSEDSRKTFSFYTRILPLACLPFFIAGVAWPAFGSALLYIYLLWTYQHYSAQAFGIGLIYCYKRGYFLNQTSKELFRWLMLSLPAFQVIRSLTFKDRATSVFFGVQLPFWGPLPTWIFELARIELIAVGGAFAVAVLYKLVKDRQFIPVPTLMLLATAAAFCLSYGGYNLLLWVLLPGFFHGSQYLAVSLSYYLKERGLTKVLPTSQIVALFRSDTALKYWGVAVMAGSLIYIGIPYFFYQLGCNFTLVAGTVVAVVNFHHYITDAAIWRLRDPKTRKLLVT